EPRLACARSLASQKRRRWIPAFAGMTSKKTAWTHQLGVLASRREIFVLEPHIVLRRVVQLLDLRIGQLARAAGRISDPQFAFADGFSGRHDGAGADHRVLAHDDTVEHG